MSRGWSTAIAGLLLIGLVSAAAAFLYLSTAPHFVAALLTQVSGRRVEIAELELRARVQPEIVIRDLRVWPQDDPEGEPVLEVPKLRALHLWRRLLAGQLMPLDWRARQPRLRVELPAADPARGLGEWLAALPDPPRVDLEVRGGSLEIVRPDAPTARLEEVHVELRRRGLSGALAGTARAELRSGDRRLGAVTADLSLDNALRVRSRVDALELAEVASSLIANLTGHVSGGLELVQRRGELGARFDLVSSDLRFGHAALSAPIAPVRSHLAGTAELDARRVDLSLDPLSLDRLITRGTLSIDLRRDGRLRAALRIDPFEPGLPAGGQIEPIRLLALRFANWERIASRIEGGRVLDGRIDADLPLAELGHYLEFDRVLDQDELHVRARVEGGTYRPRPESDPLHDISGDLEIAGNVLRVGRLRMSRRAEPLPELEIEVDGMNRVVDLPADERRTPDGPGVPIPGLTPAFRALRSDPVDAEADEPPPPPLVLEVEDGQIGFPAFVLPIRDARARLRFPPDQLVVEDAEGVVGGAPARFDALWDQREDRVRVSLRYLDGAAPPRRDPGPYWVSGRVRAALVRFGGFRIERFETDLRGSGANVELARTQGDLGGGRLEAQGNLSLAERDAAPYGFTTALQAVEVARINPEIGLEPGTLAGRGALEGSWTGRLRPGRRFLADARFEGSASVESGVLAGLPPAMVLARLSSLQGVRALFGQPLPFDRIHADFTIDLGRLRSENFALVGPELRILAQGELDLVEPEHSTDMIVALLLFETVDRVLGRLPVVGRWVLGKDESLVAVTIRLEGPWKTQRATVLPPEAVRDVAGWAGVLLSAGREQIEKILSGELLPTVKR